MTTGVQRRLAACLLQAGEAGPVTIEATSYLYMFEGFAEMVAEE